MPSWGPAACLKICACPVGMVSGRLRWMSCARYGPCWSCGCDVRSVLRFKVCVCDARSSLQSLCGTRWLLCWLRAVVEPRDNDARSQVARLNFQTRRGGHRRAPAALGLGYRPPLIGDSELRTIVSCLELGYCPRRLSVSPSLSSPRVYLNV